MSSSEQPRPLLDDDDVFFNGNVWGNLFSNESSRRRNEFLHSLALHDFRHLLRDLDSRQATEVQQPRWRIEIRRSNESEEANPNEGCEYDDLPELEPSNEHGEVNDVNDNEAVNETVNDDHEGEQESIEHHFYAPRNPAPRPRFPRPNRNLWFAPRHPGRRIPRNTHPHRPRWMSDRAGGREEVELGDANPNEGYHDYDVVD